MDGEDDFLGSLGLGKLLASEGVDTSGLSNILSRGGGASTSNELANIDNESDDDAKYEDDLSDQDLLPETEAEKAARAKEKQEEARYRRMALQMNKELEAKRANKGKGKAKEDPKDVVKRIWPDFEPGRRLRMTDIIYETPHTREQYKQASYKRKRQKVVHESIRMSGSRRPCQSADDQIRSPLLSQWQRKMRDSWRIYHRFGNPNQGKHHTKLHLVDTLNENGFKELAIYKERL